MKHDYICQGKRINLVPLEAEDIEELRILRNSLCNFFISTQEVTQEQQKKWYTTYVNSENDIMFKVEKKNNQKRLVGAVALYNVNITDKSAVFGRLMVNKIFLPENGIGTEITELVCQFGFEVLGLRKIVADVLKTNYRAMKVYKKVGFYVTGMSHMEYLLEITPDLLGKGAANEKIR